MMKNLYKDLVFRFIDRMNDPCEGVDPAEQILKEFVVAFEQVWRNDPENVIIEPLIKEEVSDSDSDNEFVTLDDDGGVIDDKEDEDCPHIKTNISSAGRYCEDCDEVFEDNTGSNLMGG